MQREERCNIPVQTGSLRNLSWTSDLECSSLFLGWEAESLVVLTPLLPRDQQERVGGLDGARGQHGQLRVVAGLAEEGDLHQLPGREGRRGGGGGGGSLRLTGHWASTYL